MPSGTIAIPVFAATKPGIVGSGSREMASRPRASIRRTPVTGWRPAAPLDLHDRRAVRDLRVRPQILSLFRLDSGDEASLGYGLIKLLFLVGDLVTLLLVDRLGRRPVVIGGFAVSALGLLYLAIAPDSAVSIIVIAFAAYAVFTGGPSILEWI